MRRPGTLREVDIKIVRANNGEKRVCDDDDDDERQKQKKRSLQCVDGEK